MDVRFIEYLVRLDKKRKIFVSAQVRKMAIMSIARTVDWLNVRRDGVNLFPNRISDPVPRIGLHPLVLGQRYLSPILHEYRSDRLFSRHVVWRPGGAGTGLPGFPQWRSELSWPRA